MDKRNQTKFVMWCDSIGRWSTEIFFPPLRFLSLIIIIIIFIAMFVELVIESNVKFGVWCKNNERSHWTLSTKYQLTKNNIISNSFYDSNGKKLYYLHAAALKFLYIPLYAVQWESKLQRIKKKKKTGPKPEICSENVPNATILLSFRFLCRLWHFHRAIIIRMGWFSQRNY